MKGSLSARAADLKNKVLGVTYTLLGIAATIGICFLLVWAVVAILE